MPDADNINAAALRERVKELSCLYSISQVSLKPELALPGILQEIARILPAALQFPDQASAQILLDGRRFDSRRRPACGARQQAPILVHGQERGYVRVGYPRAFKPAGRLFLDDEGRLLDEVARQVSLIVLRKETAAEQERWNAKLRHADRLATIGHLAAGVAHELNEPLGGILGFAQLLAKTPRLPPQARRDAAKIEAAALHARKIIRQLMTFARQTSPRDTRLNVNRLILDSADIWLPRCESAGVQVEYALDEFLPEILADDGQLRQVVTNLIVNAVQAMPDGGALRIATTREGDWLQLSIADTGCGIAPEALPRIFDPFFTTKDVDQGTGLGLSVVHGIVAGHQGRIAIQSEPGRGTRVIVSLPISLRPAQPAPPGDSHAKT